MQAIVPDELQALKEPNLFPAGIQFIKAKKAKATELMMMKFDLTNTKCVPGKKKRTSRRVQRVHQSLAASHAEDGQSSRTA
eukprot:s5061_g3.t1